MILKTEDLRSTIAWYEAIGFELAGAVPEDEPTWAELGRDRLIVQFVQGDTPWDGPPTLTGCLYVHPASVRSVYDQVKDVVTAEWGVEERPWGARELTLRDPNGYFVTFTEPAGPDDS